MEVFEDQNQAMKDDREHESELETNHTDTNKSRGNVQKGITRSRDIYVNQFDKKLPIMQRKAVRFHNNENLGPKMIERHDCVSSEDEDRDFTSYMKKNDQDSFKTVSAFSSAKKRVLP